jgi:hypothetical protein
MRKTVALVWWWFGTWQPYQGCAGQLKLKAIAWGGGQEAPSESLPDFGRLAMVAPVGVTLLLGGAFVESSSTFRASKQAIRLKGPVGSGNEFPPLGCRFDD